ncbi:MAG TPA: ATP-grasp domain-containing protein [Candidatus Eisenbacteria bacterium]|nr:ATP-grasp domain-containing protein [Candidatus Eisenbacteria bacterium]
MNVLAVGHIESLTLNVLRCLASAGHRGYVMAAGEFRAARGSRHCAGLFSVAASEYSRPGEETLSRMKDFCGKNNIEFVVPCDTMSIFFVCQVRDRIERYCRLFPVPPMQTLETMNDKWSFSRFLEARGLPQPRTRLLETASGVPALGLAYPVVVKPLDQGDGIGVKKIDSVEDLTAHVLAPGRFNRPPLVAQEFVPGHDIDMNLLAVEGRLLAWNIQESAGPGVIRFVENGAVAELGRRLVEASGFTGVANLDMRLDDRDGSCRFIECNPRFWGSLRASLWDGINFVETGLLAAQGKPLPAPVRRGIRYEVPSKALAAARSGDFSPLGSFSRANWKDLGLLASDPVPFCRLAMKRLREKRR